MAKGKLFEYVVLYHPKGDEKKSEIVKDVTRVMASSEQEVRMIAARAIGGDYDAKLEDVEIIVRSSHFSRTSEK